MPGRDGLSAIREIRGRSDLKSSLPIIVVTAEQESFTRDACLEAGADEILVKPVAMQRLFDTISRTLIGRDPSLALLT